MTTHFRQGSFFAICATAVIAVTGAASAQTTIITREPVESRTVVTEQPLVLSPTQRTTVYRTITRERVAVPPATVGVAPRPTVEYRVGMRVPDSVELYAVPDTVVADVPTTRPYKYMTVNNRVWLVDPNTSQIVAEVAE